MNYKLHITKQFKTEDLQKGLYIFIYRASRIPPHLGILLNGKLYDISLQGPNIALDVNEFCETIGKRKMETVFIELQLPVFNNFIDEILVDCINKYQKVSEEVSCLFPIREFLASVFYNPKMEKADFIFELIPVLEEHKLVKDITQLNLAKKLKNNALTLNTYSKEDIKNCIAALNRKEELAC
jgi:hypothetical protein